ncbi:MAG TPA: ABC transporter permease, partial [Acidobacteriaceae bacterium]|nr:ABC transporter permease [Acidobacteriaceae bacterium]
WYTENFFDLKKEDGSTQFSINVEASPNFFSMLQARPLMGRTFLPKEGNGGNAGVAVLSYYVWQNNFNGDKNILGRTIHLGSNSYTVVGVMPSHFYIGIGDDGPVVWTILGHAPNMEDRGNGFLNGLGRLRAGVTIASAKAELTGIQTNIAKQYASEHLNKDVAIVNYRDSLVGSVRRGLLTLQGAVFLVWLIACVNIAGLVLTRMTARRREIAIRAALGAPKGRIVRQFLTESLLLGLCGGLVGLGIAGGSLALLRHSLDASLSRSGNIALNGHVVLLLIVLSIVSAGIFGTAPALEAASANPQEALHEGSRGTGTGRKQLRLRNALIIGELALSLILLVSAGLLLRTLYALQQVHLGFNPQKLVVAQFLSKNGIVPTAQDQNTPDIRETIYKPVLERLRHLPGVESAALLTAAPLSTNVQMNDTFGVIGNPSANESNRTAQIRAVTPEVYRTLQIRLLQGRLFNEQDHIGAPTAVIVNEAFARQYLGAQPIGKRLNLDLSPSTKSVLKDATVVGVVENTPQNAIGQPAEPEVAVDMYQVPVGDDFYPIFSLVMQLAVRTEQKPDTFIPEISRILTQVSTTFVVSDVQTMQQKIDGLLGSQRLAARLLWIFAIAAVLIAAAGLYGLLSYNVSERTRDIGVQLALGAQREDILKLIMKQALRLVGAGIAVGIVGAYFATRFLRSFLYGVEPHDLLTIAAVSILLAIVGLLASYIPARRAANIEPIVALRAE